MKETSAAYRITDFAPTERPRERLAELGPQALSNAELIAILLRVGVQGENAVQVAARLLASMGGLGGLHRAAYIDLCREKGIGAAKASQIKAAIELGRRLVQDSPDARPEIHNPRDAYQLVQYEMSALTQEHLWVANLDTRNRVINIEHLYKGTLNSSTVRVAEVFRSAIQRNAASITIFHNHPSGDPLPSPEDIKLTRALVSAGKILEIEVLDHLVIGRASYVSLREKGLGFE